MCTMSKPNLRVSVSDGKTIKVKGRQRRSPEIVRLDLERGTLPECSSSIPVVQAGYRRCASYSGSNGVSASATRTSNESISVPLC